MTSQKLSIPQNRVSLSAYFLPRLSDAVFVTLFIGVIGLGPRLLNVDGDLGRHLTIGEHILQSQSIPRQDPFSHTMTGEALTPHEWLIQVVFALVYRLAGLDGVVWFCALVIATTFTLVYRECLQRGGLVLPALLMTLAAAAAARLHWLSRPHLITMLLVVVWVAGLERLRRGERFRWWLLPLVMLLWVNLHGAFIAGLVIWAIYGAGHVWDRWFSSAEERVRDFASIERIFLAVGGLSLLMTLLNPAGWHVWATSVGYIRNRYLVGHTVEYLPPDFHVPGTWPFLGLIVLSILLLGKSRARLPMVSVLLLAAWTAMGLYSTRNVPLYALIAAPILASVIGHELCNSRFLTSLPRLDDRLMTVDRSLRGHLWPLVTVLLLALVLYRGMDLDFDGQGNRFDPAVFPTAAVDWLENDLPPGRVFNYFTWGGYLLYRLWPELQVFIDGQTDFYGEALTRQYEQVINMSPGWRDVLAGYQVDWVLMPVHSSLVKALQVEPGWRLLYDDEIAAVLERVP